MNVVMTMAVGSRVWGDFALNLCLSIKSTFPKAKVALIHDGVAILGLEDQVERFFDYSYRVQDSKFTTAYEHAFYLKTQLCDIAQAIAPKAEGFIFLDADVIMLPGRSVDAWFDELIGVPFTAWCNDAYDYRTKTRNRNDYTFWCDPSVLQKNIENDPLTRFHPWSKFPDLYGMLPQINSSFLYFEPGLKVRELFEEVKAIWDTPKQIFEFQQYKGVKPDEFCFNVACLKMYILPHKIPFYPVFFQFASEHHEELYILSNWPAMGFAGETRQCDHMTAMYNKYVGYYRRMFDVEEPFKFDNTLKALADTNPIRLEPKQKRTLYRRGEVPGSDGGIFNPSGLELTDGSLMTIFRKEQNHNATTGYKNESAVPYLQVLKRNTYREENLNLDGFEPGDRVEDFRLFVFNGNIYCSHTLIKNNLQPNMRSTVALSHILKDGLILEERVELPVPVRDIEKNWVFVGDGKRLFCIYSLQPYLVFERVKKRWVQLERPQPDLKWFHYNQYICNSTNPVLIDEYYLMFFHTKENGVYHHGAALLSLNLEIKFATRNSIIIKESAIAEGIARGIVYVSGCAYLKKQNTVRVLFGEGDSSACYVDYDKNELLNAIKKYPV